MVIADAPGKMLLYWLAADWLRQWPLLLRWIIDKDKVLVNPSLSCAMERCFSLAGAKPAQQLSLRSVASEVDYGVIDMV